MGRTGGWEASKHLRVKQTIKRKKETKKTNSTNKQWPPQRPRNAKKIVSRSLKNLQNRDQNGPKTDLGAILGDLEGSRSIKGRRRSRPRPPGMASGRQVGSSWPPSWPSWLPCWSSWTASWQPEMIQTTVGAVPEPLSNACVSSNGVRIYFWSVFDTIVASPNLNFHQPAQCFVHFARS